MKNLFNPIVELISNAAVSWIIDCGLIYLAFLCFGIPFSVRIATGIWLVMLLIRSLFTGINKQKK